MKDLFVNLQCGDCGAHVRVPVPDAHDIPRVDSREGRRYVQRQLERVAKTLGWSLAPKVLCPKHRAGQDKVS